MPAARESRNPLQRQHQDLGAATLDLGTTATRAASHSSRNSSSSAIDVYGAKTRTMSRYDMESRE